jgi:hypothetical protein
MAQVYEGPYEDQGDDVVFDHDSADAVLPPLHLNAYKGECRRKVRPALLQWRLAGMTTLSHRLLDRQLLI